MQQRASGRGAVSVPRNAILVLALICLIAEITAVVHLMGGTDGAFPHLMYIPIILSAYYFSTNVMIICYVPQPAVLRWAPGCPKTYR